MLSPLGGTSTSSSNLCPLLPSQQAAERRNRPGQGRGGALLGHDTPMCL